MTAGRISPPLLTHGAATHQRKATREFRPVLDSTSPKTDKSVPSWNIPPQDTEAVHPPLRTTTAKNPKSTFWVSPLLGTLQEGFCPPGWLTSKPPLMDTSGHFGVHLVPGGRLATMLPTDCSWSRNGPGFISLQKCEYFLQEGSATP